MSLHCAKYSLVSISQGWRPEPQDSVSQTPHDRATPKPSASAPAALPLHPEPSPHGPPGCPLLLHAQCQLRILHLLLFLKHRGQGQ